MIQNLVVYALVAGAVVYLVFKYLRKRRKKNCEPGCDCHN